MRTIDADALLNDICELLNQMTNIGIAVDGEWLWGKLNDALDNAPTIEPQRMRGKWILGEDQREEDRSNGNYIFFCSNCSHADLHTKTVEVPYCWYCGADMREE